MWKKIVGVFVCILFLVMVSIPIVNAETIIYPKEDGPYFVYISGRTRSMGWFVDKEHEEYKEYFNNHTSPFWNIPYPCAIHYDFGKFTTFIVNGILQNTKNLSSRFQIKLKGFKGYAPTHDMMILKLLIGRLRIIGICDEIRVEQFW